jgi:hypothetical protein
MYPYHVQRVQHLGPVKFVQRLEFCKWLNGSRLLHSYILFTDEAQFNRDGVNNTHNSYVWAYEKPHATSPDLSPLDYSVWGWMKELVYSVKVGTRDGLLRRILDAADRIRNSRRKLHPATRAVHTERQPVLLPAGAFSKTSFKHRSMQIKGNFTKLTLQVYFKCVTYYAGLVFCSVYCE